MSPKKAAAAPKATKAPAKAAKAPAKAAKGAKLEAAATAAAPAPSEDDEEAAEEAAAKSRSSTINLEEVTGPPVSASGNVPKNFRNHPDMENFYRFIYEHDLRIEALEIIDQILATRVPGAPKAARKGKAAEAVAVQ